MIRVTMFSSADKIKGQGVGSAYLELIGLIRRHHSDNIDLSVNQYSKTTISHYHTIDPQHYISTFFRKRFGRRIGYVHFVPSTLKGSIQLPKIAENIFYHYVIAFYKRMDHLVVVNPIFIKELEKYGIPREKITYIPNFVAEKDFFPYPQQNLPELREKLGMKKGKFVVFGAGQVQERKGIDDFIKLAEALPDIEFYWAGGFSFGRITDGYEKYKKVMKNPPGNLTFTGILERNKMLDYYNAADLFLLPSYDELFPMCILEAFSCHTPVMLRDLTLYHPVLSGYYVPAKDLQGMIDGIHELHQDPVYYQQIKEKAIAGNSQYSEERLAKIWRDFYEQQAIM